MKKFIESHQRALAIAAIGFAISFGFLVGKPEPELKTDFVKKIPAIETLEANPSSLALSVKTQGTIEPRLKIDISSQVSGLVIGTSKEFFPGSYFTKNETLVFIEQADYEYAIAKAESQLAAARQRVAEEKGRALQAKRQWQQLGSSEANSLFLREPQLAAAIASEHAATQELEAANRNLNRTKISAPFNGRILGKFVDIGQFVGPGARLAQVHSIDVVLVRLPLTDRQVALLDLPLRMEDSIRLEIGEQDALDVDLSALFGGQIWTWRGKIARTEAQIDVNSRLLYAVAEIENPFTSQKENDRPPLVPGMFVSAKIMTKKFDGVTVVPRSVLTSNSTIPIINNDNRFTYLPVTVLKSDKENVWILGLKSGTKIVTGDSGTLKAGQEVLNQNSNQFAKRSDLE